jgi:ABC-2 type transport system permease protein
MNALLTLAAKDLKLMRRDKLALFWALGFPVVIALLFGSIFGGGGGAASAMPVAVIDEDHGDGARAFVGRLAASDALAVQPEIHDVDAARDAVRRGKLVAYIRIAPGFGSGFALFGGGEQAPLEIGIDPARRAEAGFLQGILMQAAFQGMADRFRSRDVMRGDVKAALDQLPPEETATEDQKVLRRFLGDLDRFAADSGDRLWSQGPFGGGSTPAGSASGSSGGSMGLAMKTVSVSREREREPRTAYEITFPAAILWGLLGCASTFALSLVKERLSGTLLRLRAAPLSRTQLLAGKALSCVLACLGVMTILLLFGHFAFGMRLSSPGLLLLGMLSSAACFTGIMMLLSTAGRTPQAVAGTGWGIFVVMSMIGGGSIPLIMMPPWMRSISSLSPVKWGILALEGAIWREFSLAEMALPCGILLAVGLTCFAAGAAVLSRQEG